MTPEDRKHDYEHDRCRWIVGLRVAGLTPNQIAEMTGLERGMINIYLGRYGEHLPDGEYRLSDNASMLGLPVWLVAQNVSDRLADVVSLQ